MREGWRETTLGDVLRQVQRTVSKAERSVIPFAGLRWYAGGVYRRADIDAATVKTKTLNQLKLMDITYNRMWATKAAFGVVGPEADGCLVTNDFPTFRADIQRLLPGFIDLLFGQSSFQRWATALATGTTERRRLKEKDFLTIPILLPPLDEQRRIVDLIAAVDEAIEAAEAMKGAADQARHGLLGELLSEERAEHEGWRNTTLGEVADVVRGVSWSKDRETWSPEPSAVPVVRIGNVQLSGIDMRERLFVRAVSMRDLKAKAITPDTILMVGSNGNPERVGNVYLANNTLVGHLFASFIIGIRVSSGVSAAYVWRWLQQRRTQAAITEATAGSTGLMNLSLIWLRNLPILLPPLDEQRRIVDIISAIDDQASTADSLTIALRTLRSALLSDLLSGDHEIPASYDALLSA